VPERGVCAITLDHLAVSISPEVQSINACSARTDRLADVSTRSVYSALFGGLLIQGQAQTLRIGFGENDAGSVQVMFYQPGHRVRECKHVGSGQ
jgi:hypothetical protein